MSKTSRLLTALCLANGCLTLVTATTFATGDYGAFRPQDSGAFRPIAGLLVAFAAVACLAFGAAAARGNLVTIAGLAGFVAIANGIFFLSPFHVPRAFHMLTAVVSTLVLLIALTEMSQPTRIGPFWPVWMILLGAAVGGVALLAVGRYEFAPGDMDPKRAAGIVLAILGLTLFAVGTGAVARSRLLDPSVRPALLAGTATACGAAIWTGIRDVQNAGVGLRSFAEVGNPWSGRFWLLLAATLITATALGGLLNSERHPS